MNNDKEKQIGKMAEVLCRCIEFEGKWDEGDEIDYTATAQNLYGAGYGNIKEFAERLKNGTHRLGVVDGNNYYVWYDSDIDNLINELYGESK